MRAVSPRIAALALAVVLSAAIAGDLLRMPVQLSDSLGEILDAYQSPSIAATFEAGTRNPAYLRPLRLAQIKTLFDAAQGRYYWLVYRGFHALLLVAAILLFVRALKVRTSIDAGAAAFALVVLIGLHTFRGFVQEAFPINHFLEMVVFCLLAFNLARSRGGPWVDIAAALIFVAAALTLESGVIVWVVAVAAWMAGWRGISRRGIVAMSVLLAGYLYLRFVYLATGVPTLEERTSGFWLARLEPSQLQEQFGAQPLWFYAYNVVTSAASVLFSEPRAGVFVAIRAWLNDALMPRVVIPVVTSLVTTGLIAVAAASRLRRGREWDDTSRLLFVFAAVLGANAVVSFPYTKDEVMSIAGTFYAIAAFAAMRELLGRMPQMRPAVAIAMGIVVVALTAGWTVRAAGMHYLLRMHAFRQQNDWVGVPFSSEANLWWPDDVAARQVVLRLHAEAVGLQVPNTRIGVPGWVDRLWED